uniref:RAD1 checkpoint DNA exonuclease n=1 Tax=Gallus gallus TaxID=9031 RepID=A0A8V0YR33_CHICK
MPFSTQSPASGEQYVLTASLDNARNLSSLLRAVHFQDHATCFATANGLRVTVEDAKCIQANAFIQAEIFQEFHVQEESVMFRINLAVFLDCLTIFGASSLPGTSTALRMCYRGYGHPLMLFLEEGGVVTVCRINTQEPEDLLDFNFCSTNVVNKIILQSDGLREAFSELDMTSEVLQITMSPDKPYFRLSTFGNAGSAHLDYPKDSDLMEAFHCNQTQTNRDTKAEKHFWTGLCHMQGTCCVRARCAKMSTRAASPATTGERFGSAGRAEQPRGSSSLQPSTAVDVGAARLRGQPKA